MREKKKLRSRERVTEMNWFRLRSKRWRTNIFNGCGNLFETGESLALGLPARSPFTWPVSTNEVHPSAVTYIVSGKVRGVRMDASPQRNILRFFYDHMISKGQSKSAGLNLQYFFF